MGVSIATTIDMVNDQHEVIHEISAAGARLIQENFTYNRCTVVKTTSITMPEMEFDWIDNDMNRMSVWPNESNERMNERTSERTERNETNRFRIK